MNMELIPWLNTYTFPAEAKYADVNYAKKTYPRFVEDLKNSATTRAGIFGTIHVESTKYLMDLIEESGVVAGIGKVNMDRNSPENLCEGTEESLENTRRWLSEIEGRYDRVFPILTPRFIPSCSDRAMEGLETICRETGLPCSPICQKIFLKSIGYKNYTRIHRVMRKLMISMVCAVYVQDNYGALRTFGS